MRDVKTTEKKPTVSVEISGLDKHYGSFHALKSINLDIRDGEFLVMVGPSGCGKSTLLRSIAGLENITAGQICVNGREITQLEPRERRVAMVFQNYALYPHMSVAQNMSFGLRLAKRPKAEIEEAVSRAAEILHITPLLDKKPRQLSGGQRQRVAIGRAITRSPEVFLFDEPLSNLDAALRAQMRVELARLHNDLGATMIYVTHDQVEAMTMADRIVLLRDGRIEQIGEPLELYNRPANRFVASFLGSPKMNYFRARIDEVNGSVVKMTSHHLPPIEIELGEGAASRLEVGNPIVWGVRPEAVAPAAALSDAAVTFECEIALGEQLGRETMLYLIATALAPDGDQEYIVSQRNVQSGYRTGQTETFGFSAKDIHLFDDDGRAIHWASEHSAEDLTHETQ